MNESSDPLKRQRKKYKARDVDPARRLLKFKGEARRARTIKEAVRQWKRAKERENKRVEELLEENEDEVDSEAELIRAAIKKDAADSVVWAPQAGSQTLFLRCPIFEVLLAGTRGGGKRICDSTPVLTDRGWVAAGDITYDHLLVAPDGSYTKIDGIFKQAEGQLFKLTFDDGVEVRADGEHRWSVYSGSSGCRDGWQVKTTAELMKLKDTWSIPLMSEPAPGEDWFGPDPYVIGLLHGDGTMRGQYPTIYTADKWIRDYLVENHGWIAYKTKPHFWMVQDCRASRKNWVTSVGKNKGADKEVSQELLESDPDTRLALLQGLMDSDGSIDQYNPKGSDKGGRCSFSSISKNLAESVQYLARSLGGKATIRWVNKKSPKGGTDGYYRVNLMHCNKFNPFRLPRKRDRVKKMLGVKRRIISIAPDGEGAATCFSVRHPSHLFVIKDFVLTHNTDALIMDFLQHVGVGWGAEWRGILFRQSYPELDDIIKKTKKWIPLIFPTATFNKNDHTWTFKDGEQLLLRHMDNVDDYKKYHGHEYPWIAWEELTNWPTLECYNIMKSCCRSSVSPDKKDKLGRPMPRKYRATTNPYGPGHNAVKKHFRLPEMYGKIIRDVIQTPDGPVEMQRVAIHSMYSENEKLRKAEPGYMANIKMAARNASEAAAWLEGSWDITSGGMFDDIWDSQVHIIEPFEIPSSWKIDRSFDWGSTRPASVGWWAQSDGTDAVRADGTILRTVKGDLFRINEWYVASQTGSNSGLKLSPSEITAGIVAREIKWKYRTLNMKNPLKVRPGPADSSIWDSSGGPSIAAQMEQKVKVDGVVHKGISWEKADKSPGSRKNGWEAVRQYLKEAKYPEQGGPREKPGMFVFNTCTSFIEKFPVLSRDLKDPDDVNTEAEDHIADETRYRIMTPKRVTKFGRTKGAH